MLSFSHFLWNNNDNPGILCMDVWCRITAYICHLLIRDVLRIPTPNFLFFTLKKPLHSTILLLQYLRFLTLVVTVPTSSIFLNTRNREKQKNRGNVLVRVVVFSENSHARWHHRYRLSLSKHFQHSCYFILHCFCSTHRSSINVTLHRIIIYGSSKNFFCWLHKNSSFSWETVAGWVWVCMCASAHPTQERTAKLIVSEWALYFFSVKISFFSSLSLVFNASPSTKFSVVLFYLYFVPSVHKILYSSHALSQNARRRIYII